MGLFSNNKKLCPVCGKPTPRLFATKVEDTPICSDCAAKIDLPNEALEQMTVQDIESYMKCYEENQALRDIFSETYKYNFGFLNGKIFLDEGKRLFRVKDYLSAFVFEASNLRGFRILEDDKPLFENGDGALLCYQSEVPEKVHAMTPLFLQFSMRVQEYEQWERMEQMQRERMERNGQTPPASRLTRPTFDTPAPFARFHIELQLEHPYWSDYNWQVSGPDFDYNNPEADAYLKNYEEQVEELHVLAFNLMQLMCPGSGEVDVDKSTDAAQAASAQAAVAQTTSAVDAVTEIKKYKELLDAGIITEEEFAAKKRQLMGI